MFGDVIVKRIDSGQGALPDVERKFLFIGPATKNKGSIVALDTSSDLSESLGVADSELKTQITAAKLNAGQAWSAIAYVLNDTETWDDVVDGLMDTVTPEAIVITSPVSVQADLALMDTKAASYAANKAKFVFFIAAIAGIDSATQTWGDYITALQTLQDGFDSDVVSAVPQLHGNNLGVVCGRLCSTDASIADSPMRVRTGSVKGLGEAPDDSGNVTLKNDTLRALSALRYSVPKTYANFPGTYWADHPMFDAPSGDYQVVENVRVILKIMRQVYVLGVGKVADRSLNNSSASIAAHKQFFARPLREMSVPFNFFGEEFPGEIVPPKGDAITIQFVSKTKVIIGIKAQPYDSPKVIEFFVGLDLSLVEA